MRAIHLRAARLSKLLTAALAAKGIRKVILFTHAATQIALCRALAGDVQEGDPVLSQGAIEPGQEEQLGLWNDDERLSVAAATCSVSKFSAATMTTTTREAWQREWDGRTDFLERGEEVRRVTRLNPAAPELS